ncbi:MAG: hypothetical protein ACOCVF_02795 [bacterium]
MKEFLYKNFEKWIERNKEEWNRRDSLGKFTFKSSTAYSNLKKPLNQVDYRNLSDEELVIFIENFYRVIFKKI